MPLVQLEYLLTCPRFPKFQDVAEEFIFDHTNRPPSVIAVCHRWDSERDPDPQGAQMAEFKEYIHELRASNLLPFLQPSEAKSVGVFYDYSALPQPERSSEGQALYEEELKSIHKYFATDPARPAVDPNPVSQFAFENFSVRAHAQTNSKHIGLVLARSSRGGLRGMFKRAWCYFELSAMARSGTLLIPDSQRDNNRVLFDEGPVHELQQFKHMDFREHESVDEAIADLMKTLMALNVTVAEDRMLCLERAVDQFSLVMPDYYFRNNLKAQFQKVQQQALNPPKSSCVIS